MSIREYNPKRTLPLIFSSYVLICSVWAIYRFFVDKPIAVYFGSHSFWGALLEGAIKTLILAVPSLILIHITQTDLYLPSRRIWALNWRTLAMGLGLSAGFFVFYSLRYVLDGGVQYTLNITTDEIVGAVFFAALTEEIMYRGFILNALVKRMNRERANLLASVMFALMHLPIWIADGTTGLFPLLTSLFSTAFIGYLLGLVFLYSGSIWGAIVAHALHNLIVTVVQKAG